MLKILLSCCAAYLLFVASPINAATATPNAAAAAAAQKATAKQNAAQATQPQSNAAQRRQ